MSTEWTRAVLGEAATNYSTLLRRSVDLDDYSTIAKASYLNLDARQVRQPRIQTLTNRGQAH